MSDVGIATTLITTFLVLTLGYTVRHYKCDDVVVSLPRLNDKTVAKYFFSTLAFIIVVGMVGLTHTAAVLGLLLFYAAAEHATVFDGRETFSEFSWTTPKGV